MSEAYSSMHPCYLDWLRIWQSPWLTMHPSWSVCIPEAWQSQEHWRQAAPEYMRSWFAIDDSVPPEPGEALQRWIQMSHETRLCALELAAEIAIPGVADQDLKEEDKAWGRHIAKALMPGKWPVSVWKSLQAEQVGVLLLRQWMSPAAWQRARLLYDKSLLDVASNMSFVDIPENRLNQLWHAVMWRLSSNNPQQAAQ